MKSPFYTIDYSINNIFENFDVPNIKVQTIFSVFIIINKNTLKLIVFKNAFAKMYNRYNIGSSILIFILF